jgi:FMN reductase
MLLAADGVRSKGLELKLLKGTDLAFPLFNPETAYADPPKAVSNFVQLCAEASGFLWISPAYHGTISGLLKNALDYLDLLRSAKTPFLAGKPVGIISVGSGTIAAVNAANTMIYVAHALRAQVLPNVMPVCLADQRFSGQAHCHDEELTRRLHNLGRELATAALNYQRATSENV